MAGSRKEAAGTIITRINGLLRAGALKKEDRPIWYDVVSAKPPRPTPPQKEIPKIVYPEDYVRVNFYNKFADPGAATLAEDGNKTIPQNFVSRFMELHSSGNLKPDEIFDETVNRITNVDNTILITHEDIEELKERHLNPKFGAKEDNADRREKIMPKVPERVKVEELLDLTEIDN